MFAPSKTAPVGPVPTLNVPSTLPSLARNFVTSLLSRVRHPDTAAVKRQSVGFFADGKRPQLFAVFGSQFRYRITAVVRIPDISSIKGHIIGVQPHIERSEYGRGLSADAGCGRCRGDRIE